MGLIGTCPFGTRIGFRHQAYEGAAFILERSKFAIGPSQTWPGGFGNGL
jgi:hypothetical protein